MGCAPHQSTSLTASPRGEALTKEGLPIFAEENFVSKIFSRQGEALVQGFEIFSGFFDKKKWTARAAAG